MSQTKKSKPKTAVASFLENLNQDIFESENDKVENSDENFNELNEKLYPLTEKFLEGKYKNDNVIMSISTEDCFPWVFADRPENEMGDVSALAQSIELHGQQEPALVRPSNIAGKYEIIFGQRRWRACKEVGLALLAVVKDLNDKQASLCQKEENSNREDISDYAKAKSYKAQIEAGVYKSESELSKHLEISRQTMNDLMSFMRIPQALVDHLPNINEISKVTAAKIASIAQNKETLDILISIADRINSRQITATNIEHTIEAIKSPREKPVYLNYPIIDKRGNRLGNIRQKKNNKFEVVFSKSVLPDMQKITEVIQSLFSKE